MKEKLNQEIIQNATEKLRDRKYFLKVQNYTGQNKITHVS